MSHRPQLIYTSDSPVMSLDVAHIYAQNEADRYEMHTRHLNEQMVRVLKTIGFDRGYVRGTGQYLFDREDRRYLDLLSGWGVFALGRNHALVRDTLNKVLDAEFPNLVQMDVSALAGLLAERHFSPSKFLLAMSLSASWQIAYGPYVADYSRYMPRETSVAGVFAAVGRGSVLGSQISMTFGVLAAALEGKQFEHHEVAYIVSLGSTGAVAGLLYFSIAFGKVTVTSLNAYGSFMSMATIVSGFRRGLPGHVLVYYFRFRNHSRLQLGVAADAGQRDCRWHRDVAHAEGLDHDREAGAARAAHPSGIRSRCAAAGKSFRDHGSRRTQASG